MSKMSIYIIVSILIVYYIFTSGLVFELTKCEANGRLDLPYSMSLSGWRTGITNIATKDDIECIQWLEEHRDRSLPIVTDYNTYCMIIGFSPVYLELNKGGRTGYLEEIPNFIDKLLDLHFTDELGKETIKDKIKQYYAKWVSSECYFFISSWNTIHQEYIEAIGVGTRITCPLPSFSYPILHQCGNTTIYYKPALAKG